MCFSVVEGFPTIKGDKRESGFLSHYNNTFQGAWSRPVQPVEKVTQQQQQQLLVLSHHNFIPTKYCMAGMKTSRLSRETVKNNLTNVHFFSYFVSPVQYFSTTAVLVSLKIKFLLSKHMISIKYN